MLFCGVGVPRFVCLTTHHQRTSGLFVVFDREKVVQERMERETPPNQSKQTKKQKNERERERTNKAAQRVRMERMTGQGAGWGGVEVASPGGAIGDEERATKSGRS